MVRARRARSPATKKPSAKRQKDSSTTTGPSIITGKPCKGCGSTTRKLTAPGPRCAGCHRDRRTTVQLARRLAYVAKQYGLTPEQYTAIWELQGGKCYTCQRNRASCVDHDHKCCPGKTSCGKCVRGLLCNPCNKGVLGHLRDSVEALERSIEYVKNPPAYALFATMKERDND